MAALLSIDVIHCTPGDIESGLAVPCGAAMKIDGEGQVDRVFGELCVLALRQLVGDGQRSQRDTDLPLGYVWTLSVFNAAERPLKD